MQRFDVLAVLYELHEAQLVVFIHEVDDLVQQLFAIAASDGIAGVDAARETVKIERPDFVLGDSGKIGIEVTRLTTESESVMRRTSKENFGKGRTAADIRANAKKVHGGKAENYSYFDLGEAVAVGEPHRPFGEIQNILRKNCE